MGSVWEKGRVEKRFGELKGNVKTDVLIIGGGIAGILCARELQNSGVDCVVVEAQRIFGGVTKNTTAKITFCHGLIYHKISARYGEEKARLYLEAQQKAAKKYERLCSKIDCDYEKKDSFVYSLGDSAKIISEKETLCRLGVKAELSNAGKLPFSVAGALCVKDQAQFDPLKFLYETATGLTVYENTKVTKIDAHKVLTDKGEISCNKIIVATHFPILNKFGGYFLKMYQHRSYVLALKGAPDLGGIYVDESDKGLSFRNYDDLLLLGGGGHRTGKKGGAWRELELFSEKYYPEAKIVGRWATQDCMTLDQIPYIGKYSSFTPDLFVATGFNKWGMTSSMVAADILCDLVRGKKNKYAEVFSPLRSSLHLQLAVNAVESAAGLLTPTAPRCPHLGCALKYNRAEHSWDCPCHGSRFTEDGKLINNPATKNKEF